LSTVEIVKFGVKRILEDPDNNTAFTLIKEAL